MNKTQLIDALAARYEGNRKQAAHALESVLDTITREVARGEKVAITGFGSFEKSVRNARWVRNPQTGERMKSKKKSVPKFTAGPGAQEHHLRRQEAPEADCRQHAEAAVGAGGRRCGDCHGRGRRQEGDPGQEGGARGEEGSAGQEGGTGQEGARRRPLPPRRRRPPRRRPLRRRRRPRRPRPPRRRLPAKTTAAEEGTAPRRRRPLRRRRRPRSAPRPRRHREEGAAKKS